MSEHNGARPSLDVRTDLYAHPWDLSENYETGKICGVGLVRLSEGPTVAVLVCLPDGTHVVGETTLSLAKAAVDHLSGAPIALEGLS
jgi:hypothetical protein